MSSPRLIVIGAGPAGLAAALGGVRRGLEVTVLERDEVGASLRRWGPTRFFSPLSMNLPPGAAKILADRLPGGDALLTGPEFAETVLAPLASSEALRGRVLPRHRVVAVGRAGLTRLDFAGHPIRAERPFRLLVETPEGERTFEAEAVIDASGTYGHPTAAGLGGIPAAGERALAAERIIRDLGALHARRSALARRRVLLIGHGHSAANAVAELADLADQAAGTQVVWATRSLNLRPCTEIANDPLPERQKVVARANQLALRPPGWLTMERKASVEAFNLESEDRVRARLSGGREVSVDQIVALTGYRPDLSFLSELAIALDPATEGPARLARALTHVTDCLSVPSVRPEDLSSGEPGFYFAGAKSYGRSRTFLLQTGYHQLETILDLIASGVFL
ncbi:MAG TPA: NAD(P)-binding domain-containing protein [Blastocatellia bacterium]|nr:NAD(P)-binding domain-containing protein [Blastocatellia bacterium]